MMPTNWCQVWENVTYVKRGKHVIGEKRVENLILVSAGNVLLVVLVFTPRHSCSKNAA